MISKKRTYIFISILIFTGYSNAQMRQDIGFRVEWGGERNAVLEYRLPFAHKTYFVSALTFGGESHYPGSFDGTAIASVNDTLVEYRPTYTWKSGGDLRIGLERQLKWPVLSARADVLLGYRIGGTQRRSSYMELENGTWQSISRIDLDPMYPSKEASLRSNILLPGFSMSMHLNLPLGNRLLVNLQAAYTGYISLKYSTTELSDPLNEFNPQTGNIWGLDFNARLGVGLKYKFGKEKDFVRKGEH